MNTKPAKSTYSIPPKSLRFPEACGDLQVNACRNATCEGFGVEALTWVKRGRPTAGHAGKRDNYRLINKSSKMPDGLLMSKLCGSSTAIKSNKAIRAEFERISSYLQAPDEPSCPSGACCNRGVGVYSNPNAYTCKAKLKTSQRIKFKECGCVFSVVISPLHRQRKPHENKTVFQEIVTKKPIRGIAKVADLRPKAVYGKIDFIEGRVRAASKTLCKMYQTAVRLYEQKGRRNQPTPLEQYLTRWNAWFRGGLQGIKLHGGFHAATERGHAAQCRQQ